MNPRVKITEPHFQRQQVYLSDPKALYHVMVKDSTVYEETTWYLECVFPFPFATHALTHYLQGKQTRFWPRTALDHGYASIPVCCRHIFNFVHDQVTITSDNARCLTQSFRLSTCATSLRSSTRSRRRCSPSAAPNIIRLFIYFLILLATGCNSLSNEGRPARN